MPPARCRSPGMCSCPPKATALCSAARTCTCQLMSAWCMHAHVGTCRHGVHAIPILSEARFMAVIHFMSHPSISKENSAWRLPSLPSKHPGGGSCFVQRAECRIMGEVAIAARGMQSCVGNSRLSCGEHDRVPEDLEGDGAEESLWGACLQRCCIQVALAEADHPWWHMHTLSASTSTC